MITRKPASTTRSISASTRVCMRALLKSSLLSNSEGDMHLASIPAFFALGSA